MSGQILIRPIVTEKTMKDADRRKFTFVVSFNANKKLIKQTIEKIFSVNILSLTTTTIKGRTRRIGKKRTEVTIQAFKKATVQLKENQSIPLFESGGTS